MAHVLAGQFPDRRSAERALAALRTGGFDARHANLVSQEHVESAPPPREQATGTVTGSVMGAVIGAIIGALIAWLASSLLQSVATTTAAGVFVCAIVGGGIGWFLGGLAGSGKPVEEEEYRQERVELGRMQLMLDSGDREAEARDILQRFGARNVHAVDEMEERGGERQRSEDGSEESWHALT